MERMEKQITCKGRSSSFDTNKTDTRIGLRRLDAVRPCLSRCAAMSTVCLEKSVVLQALLPIRAGNQMLP